MTDVAGTLHGYGRLSWTDVARLLKGFAAAWGDPDGMHLDEPLPAQPPAYTHLWAWHTGAYARVRIDLSSGCHPVAVFAVTTASANWSSTAGRRATGQVRVSATAYHLIPWEDYGRVAAVPHQLRHPVRRWQRLVTRDAAAITFIRPDPAGPAAAQALSRGES